MADIIDLKQVVHIKQPKKMETFETFSNNQKINVNSTYTSMAKRFGPVSFFLRKESDLNDFDILPRDTDDSCKFGKEQTIEKAILDITTQFFVDSGQLANKEKIMQATSIRNSIFDQDNRHTYFSTFLDFSGEYHNGSGAKFTVVKRIKIVLKENIIEHHKAFVSTLNL
ncbi:hypothetical protein [Lacinutrix sp. MEBiC02404]